MILITGATGTVGSALLPELAGHAPVRALVRDAAAAAQVERAGAEPARGAFEDPASLRKALRGVERVFLLSPPGDDDMVRAQVAVVDAAAASGVEHVVKLSSIAADEETGSTIIAAHREIERHIEATGLRWTHLRANWFMQNELGQAASVAGDGVFYAPDVTRISAVDARDVAAVAARVLLEDGHHGRAYVLTGPEAISYDDVASAYTRVLGRQVRWERVGFEAAHASMVDAGLPADLARGFVEIMRRYRAGGATAAVSPDVGRVLGRVPRSFAHFVADHRSAFSAVSVPA